MQSLIRSLYLSGVSILLVLTIAACSSNASDVTTTTRAPDTKAAFVEKGNAICKAMNEAVAKIQQPNDQISAAMAEYLHQTLNISTQAAEQIKQLPIPEGDEGELGQLFSKIDDTLAKTESVYQAIKANKSVDTINGKINELATSSAAANKASDDYGLTECAKSP